MGFFDALFGKSQQRDLASANQQATAALGSARTAQRGDITAGRDAAIGAISPYAQGGQRGQTAYENALGINGADARQRQFGEFQSDPFLGYARQDSANALNSIFRRYGAQGMANSGASGLAVSRAAGERAQGDVNSYLARLQGLGQQGYGAAGQVAGYHAGTGPQLAGVEGNYGPQMASNAINYGSAMALSRMTGINNLLNIAGTAGRFINPSPVGRR